MDAGSSRRKVEALEQKRALLLDQCQGIDLKIQKVGKLRSSKRLAKAGEVTLPPSHKASTSLRKRLNEQVQLRKSQDRLEQEINPLLKVRTSTKREQLSRERELIKACEEFCQ